MAWPPVWPTKGDFARTPDTVADTPGHGAVPGSAHIRSRHGRMRIRGFATGLSDRTSPTQPHPFLSSRFPRDVRTWAHDCRTVDVACPNNDQSLSRLSHHVTDTLTTHRGHVCPPFARTSRYLWVPNIVSQGLIWGFVALVGLAPAGWLCGCCT